MLKSSSSAIMPSKLKNRFFVAFCLMSLIPNLVGVYIGSLFIKYPFFGQGSTVFAITAAFFLSLVLSLLGFQVARQMMNPIIAVSAAARRIAGGNWDMGVQIKGTEELEDLSNSLRTMSENARELLLKVEKLSLKDKLTGLYNSAYIRERLHEEIERSIYLQRPCSFAYINIDHFGLYVSKHGQSASEKVLKTVADILGRHLSAFDRAAYIIKDEFAVIFPDKNKKKAIEILERIAKEIAIYPVRTEGLEQATLFTVCVGVGENPLD